MTGRDEILEYRVYASNMVAQANREFDLQKHTIHECYNKHHPFAEDKLKNSFLIQ